MPVRFKASSEYDGNFKWHKSYDANEYPSHVSRWAGLRSDELGITKEPSFPSKRRVPYFHPQISKSFQWKENTNYAPESVKLDRSIEKDSLSKEKIITPDAPRLKKKARSKSAVPRIVTNNGHSAAPRLQSSEFHSEVVRTQPAKSSSPSAKMRNEDDYKKDSVPKISIHHKESNGVHRVLQKKAGMNVAPLHHPSRTSEYQKQFERKTCTENSPLLAAEQVIHNKNQSVPPFKLNHLNIETEYKSQFKGSPPAKGPKLRKNWEDKHHTEYDQDHHSPKRKDKKTVGEVKLGSAKVNISETEQKETDQRNILKENFLKNLYSPTKCYRKTEYSANYLSPSEYKYKDGAWIRAKCQVNDQDSSLSVGSMWVAEVKELREKAEYYRHRSQGSHFSRYHLNQIMSANNRFWDVSSTSSGEEDVSNNIKALDLAGLHTSSRNENGHQSPTKAIAVSNTGNLGVSDVSTFPVRRKIVWDECENAKKNKEITPLRTEGWAEEAAEAEYIENRAQAMENAEEECHDDINEISLHTSSRNENRPQSPTKAIAASNTGNLGVSDFLTHPVRRKLVWDECGNAKKNKEITPLRTEGWAEDAAEAEYLENRDQAKENAEEECHDDINEIRLSGTKSTFPEDESECTTVTSGVEGRLPTPKLKTFGLAHRTHHDLTTPATGGALLVSPSKKHQLTLEHNHKEHHKKNGSPKKTVSKGVHEIKAKRGDEQSVESPPVAGLKTIDPLPLREDPWPSPQISNKPIPATITYPVSRPVENPYGPLPRQWSPSCRIQGALRNPEFQHNGNFNGISLYNSAINDDDGIEDDRLSQISARSAASSSLASQVLERAQKRKENFWGNK